VAEVLVERAGDRVPEADAGAGEPPVREAGNPEPEEKQG
jgi:hypothetical protein